MVRQSRDRSTLLTCQTLSAWQHPESTHRSRRRFSQRATGLPRNLTFTHADEKGSAGDSCRSGTATPYWGQFQLNDCLRGPATEAADPELPPAQRGGHHPRPICRRKPCPRLETGQRQGPHRRRLGGQGAATTDRHHRRRLCGCACAGSCHGLGRLRPRTTIGVLYAGMHSFALPVPVPQFTVSLLWHPRLDGDPAHRWLRGCVRGVCAEQRPAG